MPLGWVLPDEGRAAPARGVLASLDTGQALVPAHWRAEVGNGLLVALRRGRLHREGMLEALAAISVLPLVVDGTGAEDAWGEPLVQALARGLTLYDALYLELAKRRGLPLATFDAALRHAGLDAGVAVLP